MLLIKFFIVTFFCVHAVSANFQDEARLFEPAVAYEIPAVKHWNNYFRLGVTVYPCSDGLHIKSVDPNGPASRLVPIANPTERATLELGDHITHVDGVPVRSVDELIFRLGQNDGEVVITVIDKNTNRSFDYQAQAKTDMDGAPEPPKPELRKVKALLVGLTDDTKLGVSIQKNMEELKEALTKGIPSEELELHIVEGSDCNAREILKQIDAINVSNDDSLFVYYLGHGAYDPRYAKGDPSGGHYMQIPTGDILRRTITNRMLAKRCRLTVFVSDTCNVKYETNNLIVAENRLSVRVFEDFLPLQKLFHFHSGFLDVNGSSKDEFGWFHPGYGGFFSHSFLSIFPTSSSWEDLLKQSTDQTVDLYQRRREVVLADPNPNSNTVKYMRAQSSQTPTSFQNTIRQLQILKTGKKYEVEQLHSVFLEVPPR